MQTDHNIPTSIQYLQFAQSNPELANCNPSKITLHYCRWKFNFGISIQGTYPICDLFSQNQSELAVYEKPHRLLKWGNLILVTFEILAWTKISKANMVIYNHQLELLQ